MKHSTAVTGPEGNKGFTWQKASNKELGEKTGKEDAAGEKIIAQKKVMKKSQERRMIGIFPVWRFGVACDNKLRQVRA